MGQGREKSREFLLANPAIMTAIREALMQKPIDERMGPVAVPMGKGEGVVVASA